MSEAGASSGGTQSGKVAIVTGGATGIGEAVARAFAAAGASVVVADVNADAGNALVDDLGDRHSFLRLDVTDRDAWDAVLAEVDQRYGRLDVLHLNAGIMTRPPNAPALDDALPWTSIERYRQVMSVNCDGVVVGLLSAVRLLEASGSSHVVVTSSSVGQYPFPIDPIYSMTKAATVGLVRSMAPVLAPRGIRLSALCPEGIATPMVPPDLKAARVRDNRPSIPASVAGEAVVEIVRRDQTGLIWMVREQDDCIWTLAAPHIPERVVAAPFTHR